MSDYLTAPFPFRRDAMAEFFVFIAVGAFVVAFLLIFEPFGTDDFENPNRIIFLSGYGVIVSGVFLFARFVLPLLFPAWFIEENWNIGRQIVWVFAAFSLALGLCFLYWGWFFDNQLTLIAWWGFARFGLAIGVFPIIALIAADYIMLLKKHQFAAGRIHLRTKPDTEVGQRICIKGQNEEETLSLLPEQLLYLHAAGNYVEIFYLSSQEIRNTLFRTTLHAVEQELGACTVVRLHLQDVVQPIPVSRQQSAEVLEGINSIAIAG